MRLDDLSAEGADVALRIGDLPDSSFVARKLESTRRLFIASPSYLDTRGAPTSLADLVGHVHVEALERAVRLEERLWRVVRVGRDDQLLGLQDL